MRIRENGPTGVVRPYQTALSDLANKPTTDEQVAQALDHIAISLSAIDHNLQVLVNHLTSTWGRST